MPMIKAYTRDIVDARTYPSALAHSVHFSYSVDGANFAPLGSNYGILFPKAEIRQNNTIAERGALTPVIIPTDGKYLILADYVDCEGTELYTDKAYAWETTDFVTFREIGLIPKADYANYGSNTVAVTDEQLKNILDRWLPLEFVRADYPDHVTVKTIDDLADLTATAIYSDGSTDEKKILLDTSCVTGRGEYTLSGTLDTPKFPKYCVQGLADPIVFKYEGKWYFIATVDKYGAVGLYVREADTVCELFAENTKEHCILPYDEARNLCQTFWAPEFHMIGDDLYILFAVGGKEWSPQSHIMKLKNGGKITHEADWYDPVPVRKNDGSPLCKGITLDMTHLNANGKDYLIWSQRIGIGTPLDTGSMISIAEIDPSHPERLISEPVLLSRPLYGWENQSGTINNEGPYPLIVGDKIYIAFSGGAAGGYSYSLGYLIADVTADLLDPDSWHKTITPALVTAYIDGIEGPGHNGFYVGDDGKTMIVYHGQPNGQDGNRCTYIHRVHFNKNGFPVLSLDPERDLPEDKKSVTVKVAVL